MTNNLLIEDLNKDNSIDYDINKDKSLYVKPKNISPDNSDNEDNDINNIDKLNLLNTLNIYDYDIFEKLLRIYELLIELRNRNEDEWSIINNILKKFHSLQLQDEQKLRLNRIKNKRRFNKHTLYKIKYSQEF